MMPGGSCSLNSVRDRRLVLVLMPFSSDPVVPLDQQVILDRGDSLYNPGFLVLQRRLSRPTSHAAPSQFGEAPFAMGGGGLAIPLPPPVGPP